MRGELVLSRCWLLIMTMVMLMAFVGMGSLSGCAEKPTAPNYANPFDPSTADYDGNPLALSATYDPDGNTVTLTWNNPSGFDIVTYEINHSLSPFGEWTWLGDVEASEAELMIYVVEDPTPNATNWFWIQALTGDGQYLTFSDLAPESARVAPFLSVAGSNSNVASRFITLLVETSSGDSVRIANNPDFSDAIVMAAQPDSQVAVPWDLGQASANGDEKTVYMLVDTGFMSSDTVRVDLTVDFRPEFHAVGDPPTLADALIDLEVDTTGVLQMQFVGAPEDVTESNWADADTLYAGYELTGGINPQLIYGAFRGTFGFDVITEYEAVPDDLSSASFRLLLPDDHITDSGIVTVINSAVASSMRIATSADFASTPWVDYADTTEVTLGQEEGRQIVYAQFRNHWNESAVLSDYAIRVMQPLELHFLAPGDSSVVHGGSQLQLRGTSRAASDGAAVESVKVDVGEGLVLADGTDDWSYMWDIPRFTEDTFWTLRARAYASETIEDVTYIDSVTTTITVTVTQLLVAITAPEADALLGSDTEITISGTALPPLDVAQVDSVTVDAGADHLVAVFGEGSDWSVAWQTPAVSEDTAIEVQATAYAGAESVTTTVNVTVQADGG